MDSAKEEGEEKVRCCSDPQDPQKRRGRPKKQFQEEGDKERSKGVSVVGEEEAHVHEESPPSEKDLGIEEEAVNDSKQHVNQRPRHRRKGIPRRAAT
ncbi:hypothetical protein MRB53_013310 [Persea americana]|uniref:Uncharacterized protein n=1 Tax=Persea americana TaxID=3435 RepID=A0ACC2K7M7_PERAE|nr:hypothetical protein MRB53_013310 [Persea americana]